MFFAAVALADESVQHTQAVNVVRFAPRGTESTIMP